MDITYHGTPVEYFDRLDPDEPYIPPGFARDGFIHCTDGAERLAETLTRYYGNSPEDWLVLYIEKSLVTAEIRYEDPGRVFPHIYGPLNRDAIAVVCPIMRTPDGRFREPTLFDL